VHQFAAYGGSRPRLSLGSMAPGLSTPQTVILAAGFGSRLAAPSGEAVPKPLLPVGSRTLLEHALGQAEAAGCREAIVITGHDAPLVEAHLLRVKTGLRVTACFNPDFHQPNGVSLLAAEKHVTGPFFLQMVDHVFARPVLSLLAVPDAAPPEGLRLLVDYRPPRRMDLADATKVRAVHGRILAIGKEVWDYNGVDAGLFRLDPRVFDALREVAAVEPPSVTLAMRQLIATGLLWAVPLPGVPWADVDTPEDSRQAEALLRAGAVPGGVG